VFAILTRLVKPEREGLDLPKKLRLYAGEAVEGVPETEATRLHAEATDEGMTGVSPRFVINAISNAITRGNTHSLTSMELLLALKDGIESDARMDVKQKKAWIDHLVTARKEFYNRWVKEDVPRSITARSPTPSRARAAPPTSASCARSRRRSRSPIPASSPSARK